MRRADPAGNRRRTGPAHRRPGRRPSGPWPWPSATAGGGSSCPTEMRQEVAPKNIMMIGPTGVGKTEIARRLAKLTGAPFIKVEATQVHRGRLLRPRRGEHGPRAGRKRHRPGPADGAGEGPRGGPAAGPKSGCWICWPRRRRRFDTDDRRPRIARALPADAARRCGRCWPPARWTSAASKSTIEQKAVPMMFTGMGMEQMDVDLQGMFEKILPKNTSRREMTVAEARRVLFEQECDALINQEKVNAAGDRPGREPGHHLRRRDRQDRGQRADARGRRFAAGRAARPAADRRGHDGADPLRLREDRPHPVHRRRGLPSRQAQRPDARAARAVSHPRRAAGPDARTISSAS